MKQHKLCSVLLFVILGFSAKAQITFGVKAGIGFTTATSEETYAISKGNEVTYLVSYDNSNAIMSFGVFAQYESGYLFFRPEVLYSMTRNFYSIINYLADKPIDMEVVENSESVVINVIGGLLVKNFRIGVGPSFRFVAKYENPMAGIDKVEIKKRNLTNGFNFGIGYDLGKLSFDFKYENTFSTVGDHIFIENEKSRLKNNLNSYNFSIGLRF